jgi:hypothetical protein
VIHQHEDMALNSLLIFGLLIALELVHRFLYKVPGIRWIQAVIAIIGVVFIAYTGHLGGSIVYL